jgi:hypothetical protein
MWQWLNRAGLRLTVAELTLLNEQNVKPNSSLLGKKNRQALTELIYTAETIFDGVLDRQMEISPARDETLRTILGLLREKRIFLI